MIPIISTVTTIVTRIRITIIRNRILASPNKHKTNANSRVKRKTKKPKDISNSIVIVIIIIIIIIIIIYLTMKITQDKSITQEIQCLYLGIVLSKM